MVGLTGGIGSGKSTVARMLAARGAVVIDADVIARRVVEPGMPALAQLVERFGADILAADGSLDRPALAAKAFVDDETRKELEAITHPAIATEFLAQVAAAPPDAIVIHDVPLLAETNRGGNYPGGVIVVETPRGQRLDRLEQRGVERADAERRMALQATDEERREVATWIVDNSGDEAALEAQVEKVWTELLQRAAQAAAENSKSTTDKP
jgi:dephospho-CoA kinase